MLKGNRLLWAVGGIGLVLIAAVLWFTIARPVVVLPRSRLAPGYTLSDSAGKTFSSEFQRGRLTLYTFAYTGCGERCQPIYKLLRELDAALAGKALTPPLDFITISVDPARDLPAALAGFPLPFQPAASQWFALTGEEAWLRNVIGGGFEVAYQSQSDGSVYFDPRLVLVDGEGVIRGEYDLAQTSADQLLYHLDLLYKEIEQASGAGKFAYEAAHFFACYPRH